MRKTRRIVGIDWVDGLVEDTSEFVVFAESDADAKSAATKRWRLTNGAASPKCRIVRVFIITPELIAKHCY